LNEIKKVFLKFINNIQFGGILVVNKDDKNLFGLKNQIQKIAEKNKLKIYWYSIFPRKSALSRRMSASLKIPGEHNLSNASAAYALAKALGIKEKDIFDAISGYRGAWRRMELKGELRIMNNELRKKLKTKNKKDNSIIHNSSFIIPVYDDYAHHPTEIRATLAGIARKWPQTAIICVFQPHQAQRLSALFKEFTGAFDSADVLILLDIFKVKGRDVSTRDVNSKKLAEAIKKRKLSPNVLYLKNPKDLKKEIKNLLNSKSYILNPVIIMMGAGDVYKMTDKLIK
jgi:UDP-N-acetylmuramate--alanine ligase